MSRSVILLTACLALITSNAIGQTVETGLLKPYVIALKTQGMEPEKAVTEALESHDLILFDDALHNAAEPFEFYQQLVRNPAFRERCQYIFLEVTPLNQQPHLDAYFASEPENIELLYPAFQNDYSGYGWRYQSYFDLLHTIYEVNQALPEDKRLKVIGVANPTYWPQIASPRDYELFSNRALLSYDYSMYRIILAELDSFQSGRKGIFLTNTRHAYKTIRMQDGSLYWNVGTFFHERNPGKTWSIRIHNAILYIERVKVSSESDRKTAEGLERIDYRWSRIGKGIWDSAFAAHGNIPVAILLKDTPFGTDRYLGNHMLNAKPGQTMHDANDVIIFLAPLEELHQSAYTGAIYTESFKVELERRYRILNDEDKIAADLKETGTNNLRELIDMVFVDTPSKPLGPAQSVGPMDQWRDD